MFVILEYCSNGSVLDLLLKQNQLSGRKILTIVSQLAAAIEVCHSNSVAHHDIKPNNILIDEYNQVKLADFGMSTHLEGISTKFMGSINLLAPEVINKSPYDPFSADIWSFGATILALIVSDWFLKGIPSHKAQLMVQSGEIQIPEETPHELIEIIKHSMIRDPEKRWNITQITNYLRESLGSVLQAPNRASRILPRLSRTVAVPQSNRLSLPAFSVKACNSRKVLSLSKLAPLVPK
ncbi:CAMK family protein kinase [Trichomonas vaginalis G3]|uniref:CAMK family protein kinase n=1 Tax=Trichomonas vaginalis (strain ATCC PRA-98 / G3) TaxID=412133 RepID=A2EBA6_TRIV3|nr:protein serine/threonine kinase protein [Trichomonas vaginalis G3]EAY10051.1 CAMK family protein kinase [Trichomonas vaginalis G3]KAI5528499.1 protein serine/threonine kinase protein [Trichomonas vaginalis G3]|eukprot:XP_001322274.1 CAMK family protein kinase [Trichomonas vaginalis G3]